MAKTIGIRNVPDRLHPRLKARAARAGMSLSAYLLFEIREIANVPTLFELRERVDRCEPVTADIDSARMISEHRDAGDR